MQDRRDMEKTTWFSMWFLASIATYGVGFFALFHRMIGSRNKHFQREAELEKKIVDFLQKNGKQPPARAEPPRQMNADAWTVSILLVIPSFLIIYYLSKDLIVHEEHEDTFLSAAFPKQMFMQQTIPIKKYALLTIVTLGVGGIYWLYKVANLYNAHYKAQWKVEQEIARLMEDTLVDRSL